MKKLLGVLLLVGLTASHPHTGMVLRYDKYHGYPESDVVYKNDNNNDEEPSGLYSEANPTNIVFKPLPDESRPIENRADTDQESDCDKKLMDSISKITERASENIDKLEDKLTENVNKILKRLTDHIGSIERKLKDDSSKLEEKITDEVNKFEEKITDKVTQFEEKINDEVIKIDEKVNSIDGDVNFNDSPEDTNIKDSNDTVMFKEIRDLGDVNIPRLDEHIDDSPIHFIEPEDKYNIDMKSPEHVYDVENAFGNASPHIYPSIIFANLLDGTGKDERSDRTERAAPYVKSAAQRNYGNQRGYDIPQREYDNPQREYNPYRPPVNRQPHYDDVQDDNHEAERGGARTPQYGPVRPNYGQQPTHDVDFGGQEEYGGQHEDQDVEFEERRGYGGQHQTDDVQFGREYPGQRPNNPHGRQPNFDGQHQTDQVHFGNQDGYGTNYRRPQGSVDYGRGYGNQQSNRDLELEYRKIISQSKFDSFDFNRQNSQEDRTDQQPGYGPGGRPNIQPSRHQGSYRPQKSEKQTVYGGHQNIESPFDEPQVIGQQQTDEVEFEGQQEYAGQLQTDDVEFDGQKQTGPVAFNGQKHTGSYGSSLGSKKQSDSMEYNAGYGRQKQTGQVILEKQREYQGQRQTGVNFGGQHQTDDVEFGGQRQTDDVEFGGQRQTDEVEFGGQRQTDDVEFGGQRQTDDVEFGGQRQTDDVAFGGQRQTDDVEFGGQRQTDDVEFGGQRQTDDVEFERPKSNYGAQSKTEQSRGINIQKSYTGPQKIDVTNFGNLGHRNIYKFGIGRYGGYKSHQPSGQAVLNNEKEGPSTGMDESEQYYNPNKGTLNLPNSYSPFNIDNKYAASNLQPNVEGLSAISSDLDDESKTINPSTPKTQLQSGFSQSSYSGYSRSSTAQSSYRSYSSQKGSYDNSKVDRSNIETSYIPNHEEMRDQEYTERRYTPVHEEAIRPTRVGTVDATESKANRYKLIEGFLEELEKDIANSKNDGSRSSNVPQSRTGINPSYSQSQASSAHSQPQPNHGYSQPNLGATNAGQPSYTGANLGQSNLGGSNYGQPNYSGVNPGPHSGTNPALGNYGSNPSYGQPNANIGNSQGVPPPNQPNYSGSNPVYSQPGVNPTHSQPNYGNLQPNYGNQPQYGSIYSQPGANPAHSQPNYGNQPAYSQPGANIQPNHGSNPQQGSYPQGNYGGNSQPSYGTAYSASQPGQNYPARPHYEYHSEEEEEKPSFWSSLTGKVKDTYSKAKEKTKSLMSDLQEKISK